jgi:hypothetical protein
MRCCLYVPSPALTPDMREQIDILIKSAPTGISYVYLTDAARRLEAQLLGLPAPSLTPLGPSAEPPVPQLTGTTDTSGHFIFENLTPGTYMFVHSARDSSALLPGQFNRGASNREDNGNHRRISRQTR